MYDGSKTCNILVNTEWLHPWMRKINEWLSQLPVKGTQLTVHVI